MKTIDYYHSIAQASSRMVSAARSGDWDALVRAEAECARHVADLQLHQQANGAENADAKQRIHILSEILAHDAEVRALTTPWLQRLGQLLAGASGERRIGNAYRSELT